jgi:cell division protein FtsA
LPEDTYVAGIDVGTTKICTVIGRPHADGRLEITGAGLTLSAGIRRAVIVDREDAIGAIGQSVAMAERMAGVPLHSAYVGVTGAHIASVNVAGRTHVAQGGTVSEDDVHRAIQSARDNVPLPQDREIVHEVARGFTVDGETGISRPVGMSGRRLDVDLHVVTGTASIIENIERCVEDAGVRVARRALEPIATGLAVITRAERELGVILIDVGGGTSDVAVFLDGAIAHTSAIPVGGNHVTRDLARLLRISFEEAEQVKCRYGRCRPEAVAEDELVRVTLAGGQATEPIPLQLVAEIIEPRLEEIFALVRANIIRAGVYQAASAGVVLSGGGCQLPDAPQLASDVLDNLPVRIGFPRRITGLVKSVDSPVHATGVGLALLAADDGASAGPPAPPPAAGLVDRLKGWWERLFPRA